MHHLTPLSNYSKRLTLFDRIFGTYEPYESG
jgi:sterol desaturase/sphingolipid hydroxylase (fatty acid hydroxylase superfamily)